jgi:hypothetical protein
MLAGLYRPNKHVTYQAPAPLMKSAVRLALAPDHGRGFGRDLDLPHPLAGPFAFFGSLIWLSGLATVLFRRSRAD